MTTIVPAPERVDPPETGDERTLLEGFLDFHRDTLLLKCSDLTAEQLKARAVEPSSMSLLGLVRHLTEVERGWFRVATLGEDVPYRYTTDDNPNGDFDDLADADAVADLAAYREEVEAVRAAVAHLPLDHEFTYGRKNTTFSLRWVYIHMIEEYSRHNGHADLLRERIDGATGE